jgi:hypothetical protein
VVVTFDHCPRRDHLHNQSPSVASTGIRRGRRAAGTHQAWNRPKGLDDEPRPHRGAGRRGLRGRDIAGSVHRDHHRQPGAKPAPAGSRVSVSGPIGRFPLPPGAQLINDGTDNGHYDIVFGSVSPSEASRFYTTALPRAGYTITSNSSATGNSFSGTGIWFTGHGYKGQIGALSSSGISFGANTVEITLTPQ